MFGKIVAGSLAVVGAATVIAVSYVLGVASCVHVTASHWEKYQPMYEDLSETIKEELK